MSSVSIAATCKAPSVPDNIVVQMVAESMRIHGVPTSIRAFNAPQLSVGAVLAYYRALWTPLATKTRPGYMEQPLNEWQMISTVQEDCFTVVQVKAVGRGSYALISITQNPDRQPKLEKIEKNFPVLPGSKVMNDFDHEDGIRNARTLVVTNGSTMSANINYYRNELKAQGWVTTMENKPQGAANPAYVLSVKKGLAEANLVISPVDGQVQIITNIVDRP